VFPFRLVVPSPAPTLGHRDSSAYCPALVGAHDKQERGKRQSGNDPSVRTLCLRIPCPFVLPVYRVPCAVCLSRCLAAAVPTPVVPVRRASFLRNDTASHAHTHARTRTSHSCLTLLFQSASFRRLARRLCPAAQASVAQFQRTPRRGHGTSGFQRVGRFGSGWAESGRADTEHARRQGQACCARECMPCVLRPFCCSPPRHCPVRRLRFHFLLGKQLTGGLQTEKTNERAMSDDKQTRR
jgi:hypothetical protein